MSIPGKQEKKNPLITGFTWHYFSRIPKVMLKKIEPKETFDH